MPVVRFDTQDLAGLVGQAIPRDELVDRLPMIGADLDKVEGDEVAIEFFPNRPDLLSPEGVARAARAFFGIKTGLTQYKVEAGQEEVRIDPKVAEVRPHIAFCRVDGVALDERKLRGLIDLQERLTMGLGRRRKRVAIGIHDAKDVRGPYVYRPVARDDVSFVPLGHTEPMTPAQILTDHEKGRKYAGLVEHHELVPIIEDADGHVLSFPPIINGTRTQLTEQTTDMLVDVTGTDRAAVHGTLAIVATALAERGGTIRAVRHVQGEHAFDAPDLTPSTWALDPDYANRLLGTELSNAEVTEALERMGHQVVDPEAKPLEVSVGAWRVDLIHPVDVVEEVAIGHGFDAFEPRAPEAVLFGSRRQATRLADRARTLLLGHGYREVMTLTLTGMRDLAEHTGDDQVQPVEVKNPVTLEQSVLRTRLVPNLLGILRANRGNPIPQSIFEVGVAVPAIQDDGRAPNVLNAAAVRVASRAPFSDAKSLAESVLSSLRIDAEAEPGKVPGLADGRTAILKQGGRSVGYFGEVDPATLHAFEIEAPAFAFEVTLDPTPTEG